MAALRSHFGLDQPVLQQLGAYLRDLATLNLGVSPRYNLPVSELIFSRLGNTVLLMGSALACALAAGIALGAVMASFAGRWLDRVLSLAALLLYSTPGFWLGLMAIILLSVKLGWLPPGGVSTIGSGAIGWAHALDVARHLVLPTLALTGFYVAIFARLTRASMLEVIGMDFVKTARAKGVSPGRVIRAHVLRNALLPVITFAGIQLGQMAGGAVLTETVFAWPGIGRLMFDALLQRDYQLLLGIFLVTSIMVVVFNLLTDVLYRLIDPRIGAGAQQGASA